MIRVAFPVYNTGWTGGLNYIKNLLFSFSQLENCRIEPFVFAGCKADPALLSMYEPYANIIQTRVFDNKSMPWFSHQIQERLFGVDTQLENLILKHHISILSHYPVGLKRKPFYQTIGWIPDFQHHYLPEMFSQADIANRNKIYSNISERSDVVILSSLDSCNHFLRFAPEHAKKMRVLPFVAQPDICSSQEVTRHTIEKKFDFCGKFFYMPNQFWKHKNHLVVFEAVRLLKQKGLQIRLLCSGYAADYRNHGHYKQLIEFVSQNNLSDQVRFLGMISRCDLIWLIRNSIAVINPSLFEGWSTTVEEAKSIGKSVILSDIQVHREQNPAQSMYFDPRDPNGLADLLFTSWNGSEGNPDVELEKRAASDLGKRTIAFGQAYQSIVLELESAR